MTYQKDYILRMIEMFGELMAGLLGLIRKGKFEEAEEAIENAYLDFLKEDASLFRSMPKEKLTNELLSTHNYTYDHLEILSELFFAEAELSFKRKNISHSLEYYEKSLILATFIRDQSKIFSMEKESRMQYIRDQIKSFS